MLNIELSLIKFCHLYLHIYEYVVNIIHFFKLSLCQVHGKVRFEFLVVVKVVVLDCDTVQTCEYIPVFCRNVTTPKNNIDTGEKTCVLLQ
jgi:hypothetical protein